MKRSQAGATGGAGTTQAAKAARAAPTGVVLGPGLQGQLMGANCVIPNSAVLAACRALHLEDLSPEVASFIAQTVEYQLREVLEDALKVRKHSKRSQLRVDDLNFIIQLRGGSPLYGYGGGVERKETTASDGSTRLVMVGERREDLAKAIQGNLPKIPREPNLVLHWLAIDGVQPAIPYNPPQQPGPMRGKIEIDRSDITEAEVLTLPESTHPLSEELELYFHHVIKTLCMGSEAEQRPVLQSLVSDTGLHELLPYFSFHLHVTVMRILGSVGSIAPFWALTKLFRCLVLNKNLHLDLYFHQMSVGVATVIANNRLTQDSQTDTAPLKAFAAQTLGIGSRRILRGYPNFTWQLVKTFGAKLEELRAAPKVPLSTLYGVIAGVRYLGGLKPVETVLLPSADVWLDKLEKIIADTKAKHKKRRDAQTCYTELIGAVGQYLEHKQGLGQSLASKLETPKTQVSSKSFSESLVPHVAKSGYKEIMTWL